MQPPVMAPLVRRRSFVAQPVFTTDDAQADKHKMERYLHEGRNSIASVYAPVTYPTMPVLAFDVKSGTPRLAFTGALRSCGDACARRRDPAQRCRAPVLRCIGRQLQVFECSRCLRVSRHHIGAPLGDGILTSSAAVTHAGTLRSNDPDRINLKKIVLTGFPVKVKQCSIHLTTRHCFRWLSAAICRSNA